jgi:hypothetical protein
MWSGHVAVAVAVKVQVHDADHDQVNAEIAPVNAEIAPRACFTANERTKT